jgi:hypothetical protein
MNPKELIGKMIDWKYVKKRFPKIFAWVNIGWGAFAYAMYLSTDRTGVGVDFFKDILPMYGILWALALLFMSQQYFTQQQRRRILTKKRRKD